MYHKRYGCNIQLPLDYSRLPETVVAAARGVRGGAADDDVVEEGYLDGLAGVAEEAGDLEVRGAGGGVAAGMVVCADDPGRGLADRGAEDFARVGEGACGGAGGNLDALDQPVLPIEAEDPSFM